MPCTLLPDPFPPTLEKGKFSFKNPFGFLIPQSPSGVCLGWNYSECFLPHRRHAPPPNPHEPARRKLLAKGPGWVGAKMATVSTPARPWAAPGDTTQHKQKNST